MNRVTAWWQSISQREQRLMGGCAVLFTAFIIYWGGVVPLNERADAAQARITTEKQLLDWVTNSANTITSLRGASGSSANVSGQPLNQVVSSTTRRYRIELIRMQPRSDSLQVWVQPVPFNQLVSWLADLREQHGIDVEFLDITRTEVTGQVEVNRLQLKRGS
ncbi:type II secretion system protein M [Vibrio nigripulchritudo]|uniref:type II secretion system protein M n=1 Tax=Vibrio nigripulchritudo TaxID=28173 RepID=UPI00190A9F10|nr:type II secretion system protein M [Vibrio nigripulchritudo]BCL68207.1 type II secretion system protein M [Vibrio nigripulchritudo]BDU29535.1 type II secretion system protein M [Vibrio nigripulchritudo]